MIDPAVQGLSRFIEVAIDPSLHTREPRSEAERAVWEILDTAWNLLRDGAVRAILAEIREQAEDFPTDEELFTACRESGIPDAPTGYRDLAPENGLAASGLAAAFELLLDQASEEASDGLGFAVEGE